MSETPETEIEESDPNADSAEGLAGGMGVSSERKGTCAGSDEEVTYAAAPTHPDEPPRGRDTTRSSRRTTASPTCSPTTTCRHPSDPEGNPRHGAEAPLDRAACRSSAPPHRPHLRTTSPHAPTTSTGWCVDA